jgi:prephenate dehydrogenase
MSAVRKTVILGVGLIGASLAAAGRRAGVLVKVVGVGRSHANLDVALRAGLIDEASSDAVAAVRDADLVVIAAPVDTSIELLERVVPACPVSCVLTDVGSVKSPIVSAARRLGIAERFVGAHPMAGGTSTGAAAASEDLYRGRTVVLTPTPDVTKSALDLVSSIWRAVGGEVVELDADLHDQAVALSSHLPQMLATSLAGLVAGDPLREVVGRLTGAGFRDTTRIAMSDADMWLAIAETNRTHLLAAMDLFTRLWNRVRDAVASNDEEALRSLMLEAAAFRRSLERDR